MAFRNKGAYLKPNNTSIVFGVANTVRNRAKGYERPARVGIFLAWVSEYSLTTDHGARDSAPRLIHRLSTGYPQAADLSTGYPQLIHISTGYPQVVHISTGYPQKRVIHISTGRGP